MDLDLKYHRYYKKWHNDTNQHRQGIKEHYQALLGLQFEGIPKGAALDIGCGMGFMIEYLQDIGFQPVCGYDADLEQIQICKKHRMNVVHANNLDEALCSFKGSFAVVTALDLLEHLPPEIALKLMRKVHSILEPGGIFICTVPNANSSLGGRWRYNDFTHFSSYTEHSLDFLLYNAGFENIQILPGEITRRVPRLLIIQWKAFFSWLNFKIARGLRRWQLVAELGDEGKEIPISLNLLGVARK